VKLFDSIPLRAIPPNAITAAGMVLGMLSIAQSSKGAYDIAAWFIALAALLDKLDGSVARKLNASSEFGVQFDSFSDFVTFGLAPAALVYFSVPALAVAQWGDQATAVFGLVDPGFLLLGICLAYAVLTAVRLAKFNVTTADNPRYFLGMPSTLSGALIALSFLSMGELGIATPERHALFPWLMVCCAVLMLCNLPLPKLRVFENPLGRAFQLLSVVAIFVLVPLRIGLWYPLLVLVSYVVIGFVVGVRAQGQEATEEAAAATV
jgi:CDP-diacylglycerol--serine O-phosphatidyltransferase